MKNNRRINIEIGSVFGNLTVIKDLGIINRQGAYLCKCSCGIERPIYAHKLNERYIGKNKSHMGCSRYVKGFPANNKTILYSKEENAFRAIIINQRSGAKKRKIEFTLPIEDAIKIIQNNCFYCNSLPNHGKYLGIKINGLDRVDNNKGYIPGNVVPCCRKCNTAKSNKSIDEYEEWIKIIYENLIIKKKFDDFR